MNEHIIVESYSWTILSNKIAMKQVDKSVFLHHGTGIPADIRNHFKLDSGDSLYKVETSLNYNGTEYKASFSTDSTYGRIRLLWHSDFTNLVRAKMPEYYQILSTGIEHNKDDVGFIRFMTLSDFEYEIDFIQTATINADAQNESSNSVEPELVADGKPSYTATIRYERNPKNRFDTIAYHGCKCGVCGFDFEKVYGDRGSGFIEVHHIKPLYSTGEVKINPATDMIPVCSNCHRMIHRDRNVVLSIEQMKTILTSPVETNS